MNVRQSLWQIVAYVEQFDTLLGIFTVYEMLLYTGELSLSPSISLEDKKDRVQKVMDELRISDIRDSKIGSKLERGISGGEAKRVNIGLALMLDTSIMLLDEPASGLDSATSFDIVRVRPIT